LGLITRQYVFANGSQANADHVNYELDTIVQLLNGFLDSENIELGGIQKDRLAFNIGVLNDEIASSDGTYSSTKIEAIRQALDDLINTRVGDFGSALNIELDAMNGRTDDKADQLTTYTIDQVNVLFTQLDDEKADKVDVYTKTETNTLLDTKSNKVDVYTKVEANTLLDKKSNQLTTYTKVETDTLLDEKPNSVDVYLKTELDTILLGKQEDIAFSDTEPVDNFLNKLWVNTSVVPHILSRYDGSGYNAIGSAGGGGSGTGDLTKAQADTFYATIDHTHSDLTTAIANKEDKLVEYTVLPDPSTLPEGRKVKINDHILKAKVVGALANASIPANKRYATESQLTADGLQILDVNQASISKQFSPFDEDLTTEATRYESKATGVYASTGKIGLKFPVAKQLIGVVFKTNYAWFPSKYSVETSSDGVTWTEQKMIVDNHGGVNYPSTPATVEFTVSFPMVIATHIRLVNYLKGSTNVGTEGTPSKVYIYDLQFTQVDSAALEYGFEMISQKPEYVSIEGKGATTSLEDVSAYLNDALTKHKKVYVPAGIWKIQNSILMPSNRKLLLDKDAVLLRNADIKSVIINKSDGTIGGYDANENIVIEGGTIDGNYLAFPDGTQREYGQIVLCHTKNSKIKGVTLKNQDRWHMIELNSSRDILVEDCLFSNYVDIGTASSESLQIDGAISSTQMPMIQGAPYDKTTCKNITIRNNTFDNVKDGVGTHSSEALKLHKNIKIKGNKFVNGKGFAIKGLNWTDVTIEENSLEQQKNGIQLTLAGASAERIRVRNNRGFEIGYVGGVFDGLARGINIQSKSAVAERFRKVFIEDNNLEFVGQHGIGFDYSEDVFVRGNSVQAVNQVGLWSYGSINFNISDNVVRDTNRAQVLLATRCDIMIGSAVVATATNDRGGVVSGNTCDSINFTNTDRVVSTLNNSKKFLDSGNTIFVNTNNILLV
jgi:hypothetical protein